MLNIRLPIDLFVCILGNSTENIMLFCGHNWIGHNQMMIPVSEEQIMQANIKLEFVGEEVDI